MEDIVPTKRDQQGQHADDDDADDGRERPVGNSRETLSSNDAADDAETGQRGQVQEDRHRDYVSPEAEPGLDHLSQASLRSQGTEVCGDGRRQQAEKDDDQGTVSETQAVRRSQHAERDGEEIHVHANPDGELRASKVSGFLPTSVL